MFRLVFLFFFLLPVSLINIHAKQVPRIVNGNTATKGQFPWQAGVVAVKSSVLTNCGGAIISEEWILTAAHCIVDADSIMIYYGTLNLDDNNNNVTISKKYVIHENFNKQTLINDIGLILLDDPITFNDQVHAITLAKDKLQPETEVIFSGWGSTGDNDTSDQQDVLRYTTQKTMSNEKCLEIYGPDIIQDGIVCMEVSTPIKNPCKNDGGDPAVVIFDTIPIHVALFSFLSSFGCESTVYPAAFTRTAYYRQWIQELTGI